MKWIDSVLVSELQFGKRGKAIGQNKILGLGLFKQFRDLLERRGSI